MSLLSLNEERRYRSHCLLGLVDQVDHLVLEILGLLRPVIETLHYYQVDQVSGLIVPKIREKRNQIEVVSRGILVRMLSRLVELKEL